jgi:hypothetical protein
MRGEAGVLATQQLISPVRKELPDRMLTPLCYSGAVLFIRPEYDNPHISRMLYDILFSIFVVHLAVLSVARNGRMITESLIGKDL